MMCAFHRLGRRAFLTDLGCGAIAIAVFTPVIGAFPLDTIYFGHGDPIEHDAGQRLIELAATL